MDFAEAIELAEKLGKLMTRVGSLDNYKDIQRCCETCRYDLGGGYENCKINVEKECGAGDYEAWEPKEDNEHA